MLDVETVADILDGEITQWNDPSIALLNPGASLPDEAIKVLSGPSRDEMFFMLMQRIRHQYKSFKKARLSPKRYIEAANNSSLSSRDPTKTEKR